MRNSTRIAATVASAGLIAAAMAAPVGAAPSNKGTTTIVPNATTLSVLEAVLAPGAAGQDSEDNVTAAFGITGNPASGVIKHVGGLAIDGSQGILEDSYLEIRNFWIEGASVSGDVENVGRVELFTLSGVSQVGSTITATLNFTPLASLAAVGTEELAGDPAGTATVVLK